MSEIDSLQTLHEWIKQAGKIAIHTQHPDIKSFLQKCIITTQFIPDMDKETLSKTMHEMKTRSDFFLARQAYKEISYLIDKWERCGVDMECHWDGTIRVNDNWFHRLDFDNSEKE